MTDKPSTLVMHLQLVSQELCVAAERNVTRLTLTLQEMSIFQVMLKLEYILRTSRTELTSVGDFLLVLLLKMALKFSLVSVKDSILMEDTNPISFSFSTEVPEHFIIYFFISSFINQRLEFFFGFVGEIFLSFLNLLQSKTGFRFNDKLFYRWQH